MSIKKLQKTRYALTLLGRRLQELEVFTGLKPTQLCKLLKISDGYLSNLKYGYIKKGNSDFWEAIKNNFPNWYDYLKDRTNKPPEPENRKPVTVPYQQPSEGPHLVSSADAGSYGQPDLSQHQVTQVFEPEIEMYLNMARQIFTSGQTSTINVLKSNLIAFHEQVQDKALLKAMNKNLDKLNKEIKTLKTITGGCVETSAARETGNE